MASLSERLHQYRLYYNELRAAQCRLPPGEPPNLETRLRQAEIRSLEELILMFANVNLTSNREINNSMLDSESDLLDVSLVTNILLLSQPSPWIVYVIDTSTPQCLICFVSPSMKRLLGWRPSDMVGKPIFEGCHPEDVQVLQRIFQPKAPSLVWCARSHKFGEYVTLRRMRRDQTVASLHGTGIVIDSRWYAWVEQDTVELKLPLVGTITLGSEKGFQNKLAPSTSSLDGKVMESKAYIAHNKNNSTKIAPTIQIPSLAQAAMSIEIKNQKPGGHSSVESLPANIILSPNPRATQAQKIHSTHEKGLDLTKGKIVLMVDDSATYLKGGQALLRKMGCEVFVATNGEDALEILKPASPRPDMPHQFDIVFMDLSMPKMDGIQVVKLFRNWESSRPPGRARTLIIAVTANDTDGGMVLCAQTGFDNFVTKPLTKKKILDCLVASTP